VSKQSPHKTHREQQLQLQQRHRHPLRGGWVPEPDQDLLKTGRGGGEAAAATVSRQRWQLQRAVGQVQMARRRWSTGKQGHQDMEAGAIQHAHGGGGGGGGGRATGRTHRRHEAPEVHVLVVGGKVRLGKRTSPPHPAPDESGQQRGGTSPRPHPAQVAPTRHTRASCARKLLAATLAAARAPPQPTFPLQGTGPAGAVSFSAASR
jgi:hypothetical protein